MVNVVLQLTLPEYGKHLYKKNNFFFFSKMIYVWHLVVQRTEEIYRTVCSDVVAVWASGISYSQLVILPSFSKLHCRISQTMTLRNLETLFICSPKLLPCAGALSHVHITRGLPTALVKNNNSNKIGKCVIAELRTYFTEACGSAKESVLHPLFFIYAFGSDMQPFKKGPIQQCP